MKRTSWMVGGVFLISLAPSAWAAQKPYLMGAMGDSITVGAMANTSLTNGAAPRRTLPPPASPMNEHPELSWAGGDRIQSHFTRLRDYLQASGQSLELMNVAVSGSRADAMAGQAQKLVDAMASGRYQALKYVTFLIGANDACATDTSVGTDNDAMSASVTSAFSILAKIQQAEPIHVLVSSFPDIPMLGIDEIRNHTSAFGIACNSLWNGSLFHVCSPMLNWKTIPERDARIQIVQDKNALLKNAAMQAAGRFGNLQIAYSDSLFNHEITASFVAGDCFHPNRGGQQSVADDLWADQPWFK